jgi:hypothetical protein
MGNNLKGITMKSTISALLVFASCVFAGSTQAVPQSKNIIENVFTLELKFGDKDLPEEYLLVRPRGPVIALNGDIIVADESKLKIFDSNGKPKKIVGREGQGPGEFGQTIIPYCSEDGYITVNDVLYKKIHIFSPDYKFIEQKNPAQLEFHKKLISTLNYEFINYSSMHYFDDKSLISYVSGNTWSFSPVTSQAIYEKIFYAILKIQETNYTPIVLIEEKPASDKNYVSEPEAGKFLYTYLSGYKIAYTYPKIHKSVENGKSYYTIFVHNFKTSEKNEIKHQYAPITIPDSIINPIIDYSKFRSPSPNVPLNQYIASLKESDKKRSEVLKKLKYYTSIQLLASEGDYIFAYTYQYDKNKQYVADVFKASEGKYVCSVYLPYLFTVFKDGYAYRIKSGQDIYPIVEKYRIDPNVYGK